MFVLSFSSFVPWKGLALYDICDCFVIERPCFVTVTFLGYLHIYVFSTLVSVDCSKAVPLLQFFFVRELLV